MVDVVWEYITPLTVIKADIWPENAVPGIGAEYLKASSITYKSKTPSSFFQYIAKPSSTTLAYTLTVA